MAEGLAKMSGKKTEMGAEAVAKIVGMLFMARTAAHMAHLQTASFAKHKALNEFYDEIVDLADSFAETSQGLFGKLDIPYVNIMGNIKDPIGMLQSQLKTMDKVAEVCEHKALENIYQEIQALYLKTLYLLTELD